jgi:hypothetical protein
MQKYEWLPWVTTAAILFYKIIQSENIGSTVRENCKL